jgi:hypothetical protein
MYAAAEEEVKTRRGDARQLSLETSALHAGAK